MNNPLANSSSSTQPDTGTPEKLPMLKRELAIMAGRFARLLRRRFADDVSPVSVSLNFLEYRYREACGDTPLSDWQGDCRERIATDPQSPLNLLVQRLHLELLQVEMLLVAGLAEEHEGYADIFRSLHPGGLPRPTLGLVAQLLCPQGQQRARLWELIESTAGNRFPLFTGDAGQPFFTRSLGLQEGIWPHLLGIEVWPEKLSIFFPESVGAGLAAWLAEAEVRRAGQQLRGGRPITLLVSGEVVESAVNRAAVLCEHLGLRCCAVRVDAELQGENLRLLQAHCLMRGLVPLLVLPAGSGDIPALDFCDYPAPLIVCADGDSNTTAMMGRRPLQCLAIKTPGVSSLRAMWRQLLPEMAEQAEHLAARYPFEPAQAKLVCADLRSGGKLRAESAMAELAAAVRARSAGSLAAGIQLIHADADWSQLVLPEEQLRQLQDAASRLFLQSRVLDDWQFLRGRRGARGVRMLFSGPPGTGKTLSAEVMAGAMGVDLLQVDLSRVVSKWIGETEKNLAQVFATAENSRAVLFFDEADVLFGKRTEVSDAHDRYANLETAYLLSRLECYDGLAILATNYRQNIDTAFSRRLEFIIEFEEPGYRERLRLWQCHIPEGAPLAEDVNFSELASQFPIVGGHIRNAAVSAAFFAAREESPITRQNFFDAIRREYEKSGKAYREISRR
ncbi:ATP-binding protein [Microbulbifer rhizosphaerae]|uniref:AAA+ ATPase domain-containing protein n=1 Tax=Microbulbifer rhizosphaerae TaxID=1562603 RepID=A0A7W4WF73_9GAMM|nr:ATP-binding protein [Microbulbifer rhizosphaerae]MBB3063123.1 hypothetical protein [Microbulbifer rhizosphaerae]